MLYRVYLAVWWAGVSVADMGAMVGGCRDSRGPGGMVGRYQDSPNDRRPWWPAMAMGRMNMAILPAQMHTGQVSIRVDNIAWRTHERVVLPLAAGQAMGERPSAAGGKIDESGGSR